MQYRGPPDCSRLSLRGVSNTLGDRPCPDYLLIADQQLPSTHTQADESDLTQSRPSTLIDRHKPLIAPAHERENGPHFAACRAGLPV